MKRKLKESTTTTTSAIATYTNPLGAKIDDFISRRKKAAPDDEEPEGGTVLRRLFPESINVLTESEALDRKWQEMLRSKRISWLSTYARARTSELTARTDKRNANKIKREAKALKARVAVEVSPQTVGDFMSEREKTGHYKFLDAKGLDPKSKVHIVNVQLNL